jgi:hypothetical protein
MSYQRVQNVLYHAPAHIRGAERLALAVIADATPGLDADRTVSIGRDDFAQALAVLPQQVRKVLGRLAEQGVDVRIAVAKSDDGELIYAFRGSVAKYRLPWFPAPDGCLCDPCRKGGVDAPPSDAEKEVQAHLLSGRKGGAGAAPKARKGVRNDAKGGADAPPLPVPDLQPAKLDARSTPETTPAKPAPTTAEAAAKRDARAQRNGAPFAQPPKISQPLQVILDTLADAAITEDEARKVQDAWIAAAKPRGLPLYQRVADDGGIPWRSILADVRAKAKAETAAAVEELTNFGPPCVHGQPGGGHPHPTTGKLLCPLCRRGAPAPVHEPDPVSTYRQLHTAAHGAPSRERMTEIAHQRQHLAKKGLTAAQIQAIAAGAAVTGQDLATYLRAEQERLSA